MIGIEIILCIRDAITMNLRQMRYIMEIAKEGNITTAAANLMISQPSLSSLLANVEKEIGIQLFDRGAAPLALTYAGEKYIEAAGKILRIYHELQQTIDDTQNAITGRLNIGCSPQLSPFHVPAILPLMMERYPGIQLNLTEDSTVALANQLLGGRLDVVLCGGYISHPSLTRVQLMSQEMVLLGPLNRDVPVLADEDGHPGQAGHDEQTGEKRPFPRVDLRALSGEPFVLMKSSQQMRREQDRVLASNHCKPKIILETGSWLTSLRMVTNGLAFTILPYVESELPTPLPRQFSLPRGYYRHTYLMYRKNSYYSKLLDAFIQTARAVNN
jgi:DNA-binding transcriptional LysR family regulator